MKKIEQDALRLTPADAYEWLKGRPRYGIFPVLDFLSYSLDIPRLTFVVMQRKGFVIKWGGYNYAVACPRWIARWHDECRELVNPEIALNEVTRDQLTKKGDNNG